MPAYADLCFARKEQRLRTRLVEIVDERERLIELRGADGQLDQ